MAARDDHPLHIPIHLVLARVAAAAPTPPPWHEAWSWLNPESSEEDRLAVYRAVRDAGSVPEEAGFFLVAWQTDAAVVESDAADEALRPYDDRLAEIRRAHGLGEDETWPPGQAPADYAEVLRRQHAAWDAIYAAALERSGGPEMALLYRTDRPRFERLYESGRRFFHGPRPDEKGRDAAWLESLREDVAGCVEPESPMGGLGLRYQEEDGFWEVVIFPTAVELVGGARDGAVVSPGFSLDLERLRSAFDSMSAFDWNALGLNDPEGPHVSVEGVHRGREVYLRVLAYAPEDEQPGLKLDANGRRGRDE